MVITPLYTLVIVIFDMNIWYTFFLFSNSHSVLLFYPLPSSLFTWYIELFFHHVFPFFIFFFFRYQSWKFFWCFLLHTSYFLYSNLKLDDDNFLLWQQQVTAIVHGLNLSRFLEESSSPPEFLTAENSKSPTLNPLFLRHQQQDHLLVA